MKSILKIINEEISSIKKDKDKDFFDYSNMATSQWNKIIKEAQKFQKISFDLENDDSTGQKRTFYLEKNLRDDQPVKYQINAELFKAGGDWELPVMYFRIQILHEYGILMSDDWKSSHTPEYVWDIPKHDKEITLRNCYVVIPPVEAGNKFKKHGKESFLAYDDSEISKEDSKLLTITDSDEKKAWEWLKHLLEKVINERHKKLDV